MFPTGAVTFLFTDIQGSTHLWEQTPLAMKAALERHNAILQAAIEAHGGVVFKVIGDAFQAAFHEPTEALAAAVDAQRGLQSESWGEAAPIGVRMGIHSGLAELQGEDYAVSHTLNRVARITSAGSGGQILLSLAAAELARENLPAGVSLRDLGEHILKGMARPEHIFQAVVSDLPQDFPPLAASGRASNNLPGQLTTFIGRQKELNQVARKLAASRLVTLSGPGGVGKTRLSLQSAAAVLSSFPDGAWLVELAPLSSPDLVPLGLANILGVREEPGRRLTETLVESIGNKTMLVILDNCEHLVEACVSLVETLLAGCPNLHILASSREALGVEGEVMVRVPSLSIPGGDGTARREVAYQPESLLGYEAIQLFVARAQAVEPDFKLDRSNSAAVVNICQRLDGIPLAIELAAARLRLLGIDQLAERLSNSFRLLTGGSRSALPRHQTLWAAIDWSYDLLSAPERVLFRRLAVFVNGWKLIAAEAICVDPAGEAQGGEILPADVLDLMTSLANKSLVIVDQDVTPGRRYRLLETVRQYAREKLSVSGEADTFRQRHRDWYVSWVESGVEKQRSGELVAWMDQLDSEFDNLRAALDWSVSSGIGEETSLRLSSGLYRYWWMRGNISEGMDWLRRGLALQPGMGAAEQSLLRLARARAMYIAGWLANSSGSSEERDKYLQDSVDLYRELGPVGTAGLVETLGLQAQLNLRMDNVPEMHQLISEAEALGRELGKPGRWSLAMTLWTKSFIAWIVKDYGVARLAAEQSWSLFNQTGDLWNAGPIVMLGLIEMELGNYTEAQEYFERALFNFAEAQDKGGMGAAFGNLTILAVERGDYHQAALYFREGARIWKEVNSGYFLRNYLAAAVYFGIESVLASQPPVEINLLRNIVRLWGRVLADETKGSSLLDARRFIEWGVEYARLYRLNRNTPLLDEQLQSYQAALSKLLEPVQPFVFKEWAVEGSAMSLDEAMNIAVQGLDEWGQAILSPSDAETGSPRGYWGRQ
jgi:predicted ATPase/class 3 adenylate cyclase